MNSRSIWRGTITRRRVVTRTIECPHCHRFYDVAQDFDAHYKGACVRQEERSVESAREQVNS